MKTPLIITKIKLKNTFLLFIGLTLINTTTKAQSNDDLLNILIEKKVITIDDAASLRADAAIKQQDNPKDKSFKVDLDFRTRTEYRNGFRDLPTDTAVGALFTNQRSRVGFTYEQVNKFKFHTSIQDVRVWGSLDSRALTGNVQLFEAYVEPYITTTWSVKIGKQKLAFDNQRLFAENDWRTNPGTHDAVNFRYNSIKLTSDFVLAFNQTTERNFGTDFTPVGFINYKTLAVSYLKYKLIDTWTLSLINAADGYQDVKIKEKIHQRFTDGGRVEFEYKGFYATIAAYSQTGVNAQGTNLRAWYYQPEVRYVIPNSLTVRLGQEVFSGNNGLVKSGSDYSFNSLYGANHRFNGSLEYFTSKPADLGGAGLVNPYLFIIKNVGKKWELRADFHLFYSQNNLVYKDKDANKKTINVIADKYLGAENDWLLTYKPNASTKIDIGYSFGNPTQSMEIIRSLDAAKKVGSSTLTPNWFYVSLSFKPQLFKSVF